MTHVFGLDNCKCPKTCILAAPVCPATQTMRLPHSIPHMCSVHNYICTVLLSLLVPLCVNNTTMLTLMCKTKPHKIQEYKMMYIPVCIKVFNLQVNLQNFLLFFIWRFKKSNKHLVVIKLIIILRLCFFHYFR